MVSEYPEVNEIIGRLLSSLQSILGEKLLGLYLCGSLVIGDFDPHVSDIDLVAALASDLDQQEFDAVQKMHADLERQYRAWDNRFEVCYITLSTLKSVRSRTGQIVRISPGEPFHWREINSEWLSDWYLLRERGVILFGLPLGEIVEPISHDEFMQTIKVQVSAWGEWVQEMRTHKGQAYAILTMCRALYTCTTGEQVSKRQAARWTQQVLPQWSSLIRSALLWREEPVDMQGDDEATFAETKRFVDYVRSLILQETGAE